MANISRLYYLLVLNDIIKLYKMIISTSIWTIFKTFLKPYKLNNTSKYYYFIIDAFLLSARPKDQFM